MKTYAYESFLFDVSMYHDDASSPYILQDLALLLKRSRETKQLGAAQAEIAKNLQALISRFDQGKELTVNDIDHIRGELAHILHIAFCIRRPQKLTLCGDGWYVLAEKLGVKVRVITS